MSPINNHIILLGFKHVGKSIIGKNLAKKLHVQFIDLDKNIEIEYMRIFQKKYTTREIVEKEGESFFRALEEKTLEKIISVKPCIISLGGGTVLSEKNQTLIEYFTRIHITSDPEIVYERIALTGQPAFFSKNEPLLHSFMKLWEERIPVYEKIANFNIKNNGSIYQVIREIIKMLNLK